MTTFALAFVLTYYTDPLCSVYHQDTLEKSTLGVVVESPVEHAINQTMLALPARCDGVNYKVYGGSDPTTVHSLSTTGDSFLLYFDGAYFEVNQSSGCTLVDGSLIYQPYTVTPLTTDFYVRAHFQEDFTPCSSLLTTSPAPNLEVTTKGPASSTSTNDATDSTDNRIVEMYVGIYSIVVVVFVIFTGSIQGSG